MARASIEERHREFPRAMRDEYAGRLIFARATPIAEKSKISPDSAP